jgi:hypothetical protein
VEGDNGAVTDAQMMTLALAIVIPLSLLLYSNSRITEAKETLRAEMIALRMEIRAGFEKLSGEIRDVRSDLKIHELDHHHK